LCEGLRDAATRVEIPFTRMHWESVHVAGRLPLARGWETQLDVKYNPLFRKGRELTSERYQHWLHVNGVEYVALPAVPLDPAARQEARLIRRGPAVPQARLGRPPVAALRGRRRPRTRPAATPACGGSGPSSFTLDAHRPGRHLVRGALDAVLAAGLGARMRRARPDGWTTGRRRAPGARPGGRPLRPRAIVRRGPRCRSR
jgi:hypothetical protein